MSHPSLQRCSNLRSPALNLSISRTALRTTSTMAPQRLTQTVRLRWWTSSSRWPVNARTLFKIPSKPCWTQLRRTCAFHRSINQDPPFKNTTTGPKKVRKVHLRCHTCSARRQRSGRKRRERKSGSVLKRQHRQPQGKRTVATADTTITKQPLNHTINSNQLYSRRHLSSTGIVVISITQSSRRRAINITLQAALLEIDLSLTRPPLFCQMSQETNLMCRKRWIVRSKWCLM